MPARCGRHSAITLLGAVRAASTVFPSPLTQDPEAESRRTDRVVSATAGADCSSFREVRAPYESPLDAGSTALPGRIANDNGGVRLMGGLGVAMKEKRVIRKLLPPECRGEVCVWDQLSPAHTTVEWPQRKTRIEESLSRCESLGIDQSLTRPRKKLCGERLRELLNRDAQLIFHSNLLFSEITDELGYTRRILFVTDQSSYVVHAASNPTVLESIANHTGIETGTSLAETSCGTNALSLAIRHREPFFLYGHEHYCCMFAGWCNVAVPILLSNGKVAAAVQVSSGDGSLVAVNMALAKLMARELQNLYALGAIANANNTRQRRMQQSSAEVISTRNPGLTNRQLEVLELYANGYSYKEIARHLNVSSVKTVSEHLDAARKKLSAATRRETIEKAAALGLFRSS